MPKTCSSCKTVSESGDGYQELSSFQPEVYCPRCHRDRLAEGGRRTLFILPLGVLFLWLLTRVTAPREAWVLWIGLNLYLVLVFQFLVVLPHELGHAVSAHLLGLKLFQISVGIGPLLWTGSFLGGRVEIRRYPFGGYTLALDNREKGFRLRHWIYVACGPIVNGLFLLAAWPLLERPVHLRTIGETWDPVKAFMIANVLVLLMNLLPRATRSSLGPARTDGFHLLATPFMKREDVRKLLSLWYGAPASRALEERRNEDAIKLYREGLQDYPEAAHLRHDFAVALLRTGKCEEARQEFLMLLEDPGVDRAHQPLCRNNAAAADVMLGRADLLEEADRLSTEAMATMAWHPSVQGTRAAVLVELGRLDDGIALARQSLGLQEQEKDKGWAAMTLAFGLKRKGEEIEGRKYFDLAVKVGTDGLRMQRLRELYEAPIAHNNLPEGSL